MLLDDLDLLTLRRTERDHLGALHAKRREPLLGGGDLQPQSLQPLYGMWMVDGIEPLGHRPRRALTFRVEPSAKLAELPGGRVDLAGDAAEPGLERIEAPLALAEQRLEAVIEPPKVDNHGALLPAVGRGGAPPEAGAEEMDGGEAGFGPAETGVG